MIHVYDPTWRDAVAAFLLQQRSFAELNGQAPETFRDENVADFETEETVSLVFEDGDVIAVADLLKQHPVDGSLWLGLFIVDERLHGTGIATRLYEQLEQTVRSRRCSGSVSYRTMSGRVDFGSDKAMSMKKIPSRHGAITSMC
ncbi:MULTISPECIES: GNAT family N-acetyltransferase [unclassified Exiguobacterium]|uniref:GNAT family N-acetyltransferase n=1 Tax=unclassified Exiguobacterium TaxID=2644629 RepID=UPI001F60D79A|nr:MULTISPECIES: GNAT family N-acetyltransferase [unclassified Exiguobacterium]